MSDRNWVLLTITIVLTVVAGTYISLMLMYLIFEIELFYAIAITYLFVYLRIASVITRIIYKGRKKK
jgi:hypothetical protein